MRSRPYPQRHSAGFSVIVSVLVLASFTLAVLLAVQQLRQAEEGRVRQLLRARLEQEMQRELLRLRQPTYGSPGVRPPGARPHEVQGAARVQRALDNILRRSFDQMMVLEERRAALRRLLKHRQSAAQRRQVHRQLRQISKELRIAELWILMLEDRRLAAQRLQELQNTESGKPPADRPATQPPQGSVPRLPDWLYVLR